MNISEQYLAEYKHNISVYPEWYNYNFMTLDGVLYKGYKYPTSGYDIYHPTIKRWIYFGIALPTGTSHYINSPEELFLELL